MRTTFGKWPTCTHPHCSLVVHSAVSLHPRESFVDMLAHFRPVTSSTMAVLVPRTLKQVKQPLQGEDIVQRTSIFIAKRQFMTGFHFNSYSSFNSSTCNSSSSGNSTTWYSSNCSNNSKLSVSNSSSSLVFLSLLRPFMIGCRTMMSLCRLLPQLRVLDLCQLDPLLPPELLLLADPSLE